VVSGDLEGGRGGRGAYFAVSAAVGALGRHPRHPLQSTTGEGLAAGRVCFVTIVG
jgi:hypothetical protein